MVLDLPRLVEYYPEESLFSYISRLSDANYYPTPSCLYKTLFGRYPGAKPNFVNHVQGIELLAQLTYTPYEQLLQSCFLYDGESGLYQAGAGTFLRRCIIHSRGTKFCPMCVSESCYARRNWDLALITTCVRHSRLLLDRCPQCGMRISWLWIHRRSCLCGSNFLAMPSILVPPEHLAITSRIERLLGSLYEYLWEKDFPEVLLPLDHEQLIKILIVFMGQYVGFIDTTGEVLVSIENHLNIHNLLVKVQSLFATWPKGFYSFLDWKRSAWLIGAGEEREYGEIYYILHKVLVNKEYDFLRNEFSKYLELVDAGYSAGRI